MRVENPLSEITARPSRLVQTDGLGHTVSGFRYYNDTFVLLWHIQVHAEREVSQPNFLFVVKCKINIENDSSTCNKRKTCRPTVCVLTFSPHFHTGLYIK